MGASWATMHGQVLKYKAGKSAATPSALLGTRFKQAPRGSLLNGTENPTAPAWKSLQSTGSKWGGLCSPPPPALFIQ